MEPQNVTYDICRCYIRDHQVGLDEALVAKIDGFRRSRNLAKLADCSCHFDWHRHLIGEWRFLRQVEAFFKKNSIFSEKESCSNAARLAFMEAEHVCFQTNLRLAYYHKYLGRLDRDIGKKLAKMRRYISNVLGDFHSFLDALPDLVKVTPGATAHSTRRNSLPQRKMKMRLYATSRTHPYLVSLYQWFGFSEPRLVPVSTNRVELVPKNWKTDRTIACEPEGNLPLQLAFDTYAKRRLRRFGINLRNQSANQDAARAASKSNKSTTVDFKAASDTISYNVVAWLFPSDWLDFLDSVRTPGYRGVFGEGQYQKFSSMGNGTTFTIETILFAAACHAVGARDFLVYGDDVIIETRFFNDYLKLTRFLGFSINESKTFHDGPFRESCGLDCFNGIDVTPTYIRGFDRRKASLCHLVNTMAGLVIPGGHLETYLRNIVKEVKLPFVPYQENTMSGVWIDPDIARNLGILTRWRKVRGRPHNTFIDRYKAYVPINKKRKFPFLRGYYLWFLNRNRQVSVAGPWGVPNSRQSQTSSAPVFEHGYVRKWVCWCEPADGMPDHMYMWSKAVTSP
jgi:hypothetical protein